MKTLNRVFLLGSSGRDPEVRQTASGKIVASFSLATNERYKDKSGEWKTSTEWHSLSAFGRTAEIVRDYVKKGSHVHVEGRLQTRSWEQDGQKRYKTEVVVENLILLGSPKQAESRQADSEPISDSDIPF